MIFLHTGNSFEENIEADSSTTSNFCTKRSLKVHKSTNDGQKQYRCTVCDKRFTTKTYLTVHSRKHTGEHLYSCSQCEKSFSFASGLSSHKNIHTGKYKCTDVACVVRAVMSWQYTGEVIQDRNHLNVLFVANDSQHQVALLDTAEFTVERNRTNVTCVTRCLVSLEI